MKDGLDPKGAAWAPHVGEDYAVVMLPDESTDSASIRVISDDATLAPRIAAALNCQDDLVAALREALPLLEELDQQRDREASRINCCYQGMSALVATRAALAKAKAAKA